MVRESTFRDTDNKRSFDPFFMYMLYVLRRMNRLSISTRERRGILVGVPQCKGIMAFPLICSCTDD